MPPWVEICLDSVRKWATAQGWQYRFVGDEIFERIPDHYRTRVEGRLPILTDLGRLLLIREALNSDADTAVWIDADVLIFDPAAFQPDIDADYAFARELWVQPGPNGSLKAYRNVHNAVCLFRDGNAMLDFYIHACEQIVRRVDGGVPNQIVGPKFLTALHNIIGFPLIESIGMASPLVLGDLLKGGGEALRLLKAESTHGLSGLNLCGSLVGQTVDGVDVSTELMDIVCARLLSDGTALLGDADE